MSAAVLVELLGVESAWEIWLVRVTELVMALVSSAGSSATRWERKLEALLGRETVVMLVVQSEVESDASKAGGTGRAKDARSWASPRAPVYAKAAQSERMSETGKVGVLVWRSVVPMVVAKDKVWSELVREEASSEGDSVGGLAAGMDKKMDVVLVEGRLLV